VAEVSSSILPASLLLLPLHNLPPLMNSNMQETLDRLEFLFNKSTSTKSYRFPMAWGFSMGFTMYTLTLGTKNFETPHNILDMESYSYLGQCLTYPLAKSKVEGWQRDLLNVGTEVMTLVDPTFVSKQYCLHFSKMNSVSHNCPLHTDDRDIGPQYVLHLGNWTESNLVAYSTSNLSPPSANFHIFSSPRQFVRNRVHLGKM